MKWFLQFLSIGSAVIYTLLVIVDHRIRDGTAENIVASEAQPNQRRLSVWDHYLPYRSFGQNRQASLTTHPAHQQNEALASKPYRESPRQYFGWFQVLDPATLRQGWIYEKYYLEAIRGPGATRVTVQDSPSPTRVALAAPKPTPSSRLKNPNPKQKIAKPRGQQGKIRIARNEFASYIDRAFRGN